MGVVLNGQSVGCSAIVVLSYVFVDCLKLCGQRNVVRSARSKYQELKDEQEDCAEKHMPRKREYH